MLSRSPGHEAASKRKAALLRAQGRLGDAASALCEHLGTHQGDLEAWAEAAEVYALLGRPSHAAFCVEELLAAAPGDARLHGQYAGLRAWAGGGEGLKVAGSHFCAQVELTGGLAAPPLWGLLTTAAAQRAAGPPGGGAAAHGEAAALAAARLRRLYSAPGVAPATARLASAAIDALLPAKGSKARAG